VRRLQGVKPLHHSKGLSLAILSRIDEVALEHIGIKTVKGQKSATCVNEGHGYATLILLHELANAVAGQVFQARETLAKLIQKSPGTTRVLKASDWP
jgi:hypothetical protein